MSYGGSGGYGARHSTPDDRPSLSPSLMRRDNRDAALKRYSGADQTLSPQSDRTTPTPSSITRSPFQFGARLMPHESPVFPRKMNKDLSTSTSNLPDSVPHLEHADTETNVLSRVVDFSATIGSLDRTTSADRTRELSRSRSLKPTRRHGGQHKPPTHAMRLHDLRASGVDSDSEALEDRWRRQQAKDLVEMKMQVDTMMRKISTERKRIGSISSDEPPNIDDIMAAVPEETPRTPNFKIPMEFFLEKLNELSTIEITQENAIEVLEDLLKSLRATLSDFAEFSVRGQNDLGYVLQGLLDEGVEVDDETQEWLIYSCAAPTPDANEDDVLVLKEEEKDLAPSAPIPVPVIVETVAKPNHQLKTTYRHSVGLPPTTMAKLKASRRKSTMPRLSLSIDPRLISRGLIPLDKRSWLAGLSVYSDQATAKNYSDPVPIVCILSTDSLPINFKTWSFDIRKYSDVELASMIMFIFNDIGVLSHFSIPRDRLWNFIWAIRGKYRDNPYHNFAHAFDVLHTVYLFLTVGDCLSHLMWRDTLALLVGALCHDVDHTGTSNNFLVNTHSRLATLYNDKSILENHHCYSLFQLCRESEECNILATLSIDDYSEVRKQIISSILYTDLSLHFELVTKVKSFVLKEDDSYSRGDRRLLVDLLLHAADLSNGFKSFDLSKFWTYQLVEEFTIQGQLEKALGLPLSPHADPTTANPARMCIGFLDLIVQPLLATLVKVVPSLAEILKNLERNRRSWDSES